MEEDEDISLQKKTKGLTCLAPRGVEAGKTEVFRIFFMIGQAGERCAHAQHIYALQ